ncbi:hypothetical protein F2Q69_00031542 [Brassica cretica]|uniref:Uncharacterized protein n=1 Tax=Brassica cretica TaxID=69181 RepID=A0A8S9S773_BRACR|nr:hypothetical protein F2Q69_00031542 [Brassica cretica]
MLPLCRGETEVASFVVSFIHLFLSLCCSPLDHETTIPLPLRGYLRGHGDVSVDLVDEGNSDLSLRWISSTKENGDLSLRWISSMKETATSLSVARLDEGKRRPISPGGSYRRRKRRLLMLNRIERQSYVHM